MKKIIFKFEFNFESKIKFRLALNFLERIMEHYIIEILSYLNFKFYCTKEKSFC